MADICFKIIGVSELGGERWHEMNHELLTAEGTRRFIKLLFSQFVYMLYMFYNKRYFCIFKIIYEIYVQVWTFYKTHQIFTKFKIRLLLRSEKKWRKKRRKGKKEGQREREKKKERKAEEEKPVIYGIWYNLSTYLKTSISWKWVSRWMGLSKS